MQEIIGVALFILIALGSFIFSVYIHSDKGWKMIYLVPGTMIGCIIGCYAVLGLILGIFWVIAWFGMLIREILQWCIEAVLFPFSWLGI